MANWLCDFGQVTSVFYASVSPNENEKIGPGALLGLCSSELPGTFDPFNTSYICTCVLPMCAHIVDVCMSEQTPVLARMASHAALSLPSDYNCADTRYLALLSPVCRMVVL